MKQFIRIICIILVFATLLPLTAFAEQSDIRSSAYFTEIQASLGKVSTYTFEIWFDVTATRGMDVLGVSEIILYRSSDNIDWMSVKTYEPDRYTQMLAENTGSHGSFVSYTGMREYYYRAEVTFYAKKGTGIGMITEYTPSLYMP